MSFKQVVFAQVIMFLFWNLVPLCKMFIWKYKKNLSGLLFEMTNLCVRKKTGVLRHFSLKINPYSADERR